MKLYKVGVLVLIMLVFIPAVHAVSYDLAIARGDLPVDLMVAQVYAQTAKIPLITITEEGLTSELKIELTGYEQQGYSNALLIGGESVVPLKVETDLEIMDYTVTRLWDWNRYGTAARVAVTLWENSDIVVVTLGDHKGTLVSASRSAIDYGSPLLLTMADELPDETKQAIQSLGATRIVLVGDVSQEVRNELSSLGGLEETRFREVRVIEPSTTGIFVIGLIVGALILFLLSSLWGASFIRKRAEVPYSIFQEDEQLIIDEVEKSGGLIKQQDLPALTDFSRPKVTRLISELGKRGILEREKRGKTYLLKLKKTVTK